jgi:hypothetical protein
MILDTSNTSTYTGMSMNKNQSCNSNQLKLDSNKKSVDSDKKSVDSIKKIVDSNKKSVNIDKNGCKFTSNSETNSNTNSNIDINIDRSIDRSISSKNYQEFEPLSPPIGIYLSILMLSIYLSIII